MTDEDKPKYEPFYPLEYDRVVGSIKALIDELTETGADPKCVSLAESLLEDVTALYAKKRITGT